MEKRRMRWKPKWRRSDSKEKESKEKESESQEEEPEYKPKGHCVGEISSFNDRCAQITTKEECTDEGRTAMSDGVCDWIASCKDDDAAVEALFGDMLGATRCDSPNLELNG